MKVRTQVGAALVQRSVRGVREEIARVSDRGAEPGSRKVGRHELSFRDLLYLDLVLGLQERGWTVAPEERRSLYEALRAGREGVGGRWVRRGTRLERKDSVTVAIDLASRVQRLREDWRALYRGELRVVRDPRIHGGQPVFRGTRILVDQVVEQLRRGEPREEVAADYPALEETALRYAEIKARMARAPGRPARIPVLVKEAVEDKESQ